MVVTRRMSWLLASTVLGTSLIALPAFAQDAQNQQKMQNEINALQQQLQTLQDQVAQRQNPGSGVYNQAPPPGGPWSPRVDRLGLPPGLQISMAGTFIAMEGAWRQHNEVSSGASDPAFGNPGIPLQNSPLYHENELGFSAQQSRISPKGHGRYRPGPAPEGLLRDGLPRRRRSPRIIAREQQLHSTHPPSLRRVRQR